MNDFLELALGDPVRAPSILLNAIATESDSAALAQAHRALAVVLRDNGDLEAAVRHLQTALRLAGRSRNLALMGDIRATYGATLVMSGRTRIGLQHLADVIRDAHGRERAAALYRRGFCLDSLKRHREAIDDLRLALPIFRELGDRDWLPRTLNLLALQLINCGELNEALAMLREGLDLADEENAVERMWLQRSIARLHYLKGDLPAAFAAYESCGSVGAVGHHEAIYAYGRAEALLAAGLAADATTVLSGVDRSRMPPSEAAELDTLLAEAAWASGDVGCATQLSRAAATRLRRLGWETCALEADIVYIRAERASGQQGLGRRADRVATALHSIGSGRSSEASVLAGELGRGERAVRHFRDAAMFRAHPNRLQSATGWLGEARVREAQGGAGVLAACGRGLDSLDEYREIMGSSELRATTTQQGRELATLGLRHATPDPRTLLRWSERWRATALAQPPVTQRGEVSPALAMLRDSGRRIAEAQSLGRATESLERERRSLERTVRAEHHKQRADGAIIRRRFDPAELVAEVGEGAFVELVDVDGILHALVVSRGRVRRAIAGETATALELADAGRSALRRAARTNRYAPGDLGQRFQDAVLGNAARMLPDGPVTISPTAALHGAPFGLMPTLADRPFSIVPSAAQWLRARAVPKPRSTRRALVSGPGLLTGGAEVGRLADAYPDATVLRDDKATVAATMKAIDGARLAHLATHGTFRADSPLFSALEMADGPLSVYELERLKRAPYRTILSACDSGVLAPVGAQEVLGLASALFSLGSAGLVCTIAEVNDEATADLMMKVHATLDARGTPAEALAAVRSEGSPVEQATAAAFVALGV